MAGSNLAGTATFYVNGAAVALRAEFTYVLPIDKRESLVGMDGFHGWKQTPGVAQVKVKLDNGSDTDIASMTEVDRIVAELANGKTISGGPFKTTEPPSADPTEGTVEMTWEGPNLVEQPTQ